MGLQNPEPNAAGNLEFPCICLGAPIGHANRQPARIVSISMTMLSQASVSKGLSEIERASNKGSLIERLNSAERSRMNTSQISHRLCGSHELP